MDKKEDKKINNNTAGAPTIPQNNQSQNTQKKQKRSRVAARFQAPVANNSEKQ